jgi:hypothetical protein
MRWAVAWWQRCCKLPIPQEKELPGASLKLPNTLQLYWLAGLLRGASSRGFFTGRARVAWLVCRPFSVAGNNQAISPVVKGLPADAWII